MKRLPGRRAILLTATAAALVRTAFAGGTRASEVTVGIDFEGGRRIPEGRLIVYPKGSTGAQSRSPLAEQKSDGKSHMLTLRLPLPFGTGISPIPGIVVELQREDGWLLARGSTDTDEGLSESLSFDITLHTVMYEG